MALEGHFCTQPSNVIGVECRLPATYVKYDYDGTEHAYCLTHLRRFRRATVERRSVIGKKKSKRVPAKKAAPDTTPKQLAPGKPAQIRLFAYGTLNVHSVQRKLWGEAKMGLPGTLRDYELRLWTNSYIFYIERKPGESVVGKEYVLTQEQLEATDAYETDAYVRIQLPLKEGETDRVWTYIRNTEPKKGE